MKVRVCERRHVWCRRKWILLTVGFILTIVVFRSVKPDSKNYGISVLPLGQSISRSLTNWQKANRPNNNFPEPVRSRQIFDTHNLNQSSGFSFLSSQAHQAKIDFQEVAAYPLPDQWLSETDREIVAESVTDLRRVAVASTSVLHVHRRSKSGGNEELAVGDELTVRLDLHDSQGRPVTNGGHEVRLWMLSSGADKFQPSNSKAAAVDVTDLGNGSYAASVPVLWGGETTLRAALVRPREFRGLMLRLLNRMKMLVPVMATFERGKQAQVTLCHFTPVVPGFPEVCNLTAENYALPWYCGKPSKPGLECRHWKKTRSPLFPLSLPLSGAERVLFDRYFARNGTQKSRYRTIDVLPKDYTLNATNGTLLTTETPCSRRKPRDTWNDQSPVGFWDKLTWKPLKCSLPAMTPSWIDKCLANTSLLFLSDSNARAMLETLSTVWHCKYRAAGPSQLDPHHCEKQLGSGSKVRVTWCSHAYPMLSTAFWTSRVYKRSPSHYMAKLPSTGNYVVLLHLYAHFLAVHSYIFGLHVRDAARGVRDLLSRNPDARVFVRGPHAMDGGEKMTIGDHHALRTASIFRQEFKDLMDRVVYLDVWGMTVAIENKEVHPPSFATKEILRLFLGHLCPPLSTA